MVEVEGRSHGVAHCVAVSATVRMDVDRQCQWWQHDSGALQTIASSCCWNNEVVIHGGYSLPVAVDITPCLAEPWMSCNGPTDQYDPTFLKRYSLRDAPPNSKVPTVRAGGIVQWAASGEETVL